MSPVGTFPGLQSRKRRTIRAEVNPMDKSTVVSIFPKPIHEVKYTVQPGVFDLLPGSYEKPSLLVVGPSSWWKDIDEDQPLLEIPNGSIQVAESIVHDYSNGLLACNMKDAKPGLFWVPGNFTLETLKKEHQAMLDKAKLFQNNWYNALILLADGLWAATNGNPRTISDDMRMAAREMGAANRDWMSNFTNVELVKCPACGSLKSPDYPVCASCHAIVDVAKATKLGIQFAKA